MAGIALTTFMAGLFVGSTFLGPLGAPPAAQVAPLPEGHPSIDPNAPRTSAPPLTPEQMAAGNVKPGGTTAPGGTAAPGTAESHEGHDHEGHDHPPEPGASSGAVSKENWDLKHDDPAVRSVIASTTDYGALVRIGNEQFDKKHPLLAIAAYEKALKLHPFDADVQTDLGTMYRAMHRHHDALNAFRKAASMDPRHVQSRYNIGVVLSVDENDPAGAVAAWKEYLKVAPPGPQVEEVKRRIAVLEQSAKKPGGS
ncbi:MAG: tetratricopeptide repeat protein [Armatimonadetes bacterium]|nr:tetratricopeptide repeat protein [Armatimonadota bacterium]